MADPQTNPAADPSRARSDGPPAGQTAPPKSAGAQKPAAQAAAAEAPGLSATEASAAQPPPAEARSFEATRSGQGASAETLTRATQPLAEGARQFAEQSRQASRQVADSWRQAVDPLLSMQFGLSQWFDEMFRNAFGMRHAANPLRGVGPSAASFFGLPPADIRETDAAYILAVELPGLSRDDIELRIDGDALILSGHKTEEIDDGASSYRVSERRYGRFERAFPLPADVERERIEAQFKDGVLRVTLPKSAAAQPRGARIEVKG